MTTTTQTVHITEEQSASLDRALIASFDSFTPPASATRIAELEAALRDARTYARSWRHLSAEAVVLIKRIDGVLGD